MRPLIEFQLNDKQVQAHASLRFATFEVKNVFTTSFHFILQKELTREEGTCTCNLLQIRRCVILICLHFDLLIRSFAIHPSDFIDREDFKHEINKP